MTPTSRGDQREQHGITQAPTAGPVAPLDVRVTVTGALVEGVRVATGTGEEIQRAVLKHLQTVARASGRPVLAMVHDERIGYVVPLQVAPDGASSFTADPVRVRREAPKAEALGGTTAPATPGGVGRPRGQERPRTAAPGGEPRRVEPVRARHPEPSPAEGFGPPPVMAGPSHGAEPYGPQTLPPPPAPSGSPYVPQAHHADPDASNPYLRPTAPPPTALRPEPVPGTAPAPRPIPEPQTTTANGTPPPLTTSALTSSALTRLTESAPAAPSTSLTPTPPCGFDAIAEAVLDDEQGVATGPLAEPMGRIGEAVRSGRVETAAELAARTLAGSGLEPEHPDVLRLRELTAYIAYLAGEGERAMGMSLDLARVHRRLGDADAAYGNVQSAAMAWRAVRDPQDGLRLGHELIDMWTDLAAEGGPAAVDLEELESSHARMIRLTDRAARAARSQA
ncbi:tetratricopeptide repeat protein [Streptomyces sp. NPDC005017]|uniref:tetratricopeptide repeat protein n=1 Tax=Streptomyces sp. NPDC005017 TaxID=3364706 RepID=UPI0036B375CA